MNEIANMLVDVLVEQVKDKELKIKTDKGTLIIILVQENNETNELIERIKTAQGLVPEMEG
jgi:outer membrane lipoprotein SlyB